MPGTNLTRDEYIRLDSSMVNINVGAIAMAHPLGSSGARLIGLLVTNCIAVAAAGAWPPSASAWVRASPSF